ncbi:MAG: hypothetical protein CL844_05605 [Crocinitomicaceae bacterium]|nr:hypothetical protein [Crocinitomicaceae bacterium]
MRGDGRRVALRQALRQDDPGDGAAAVHAPRRHRRPAAGRRRPQALQAHAQAPPLRAVAARRAGALLLAARARAAPLRLVHEAVRQGAQDGGAPASHGQARAPRAAREDVRQRGVAAPPRRARRRAQAGARMREQGGDPQAAQGLPLRRGVHHRRHRGARAPRRERADRPDRVLQEVLRVQARAQVCDDLEPDANRAARAAVSARNRLRKQLCVWCPAVGNAPLWRARCPRRPPL